MVSVFFKEIEKCVIKATITIDSSTSNVGNVKTNFSIYGVKKQLSSNSLIVESVFGMSLDKCKTASKNKTCKSFSTPGIFKQTK
jgi:hypothetical protein